MEGFIDIQGYEGLYKINKDGVVWSLNRGRILLPMVDGKSIGYLLCKNGKCKRLNKKFLLNLMFTEEEVIDPNEEWKEIKGFSTYYISSLGRVKKVTFDGEFTHTRYMALEDNKGYFRVSLHEEGRKIRKQVHRIVAEAFIPNPDNKPEVNHKFGKTKDNRVSELEWVTRSENHIHAYEVLGRKANKPWLGKSGSLNPGSKSVLHITENGNIISEYGSTGEAAKLLNLSQSCVSRCCIGKAKHTKGLYFRYK